MPRKPAIVLGLTYGHGDSAAALIINGTLVAAVEEERFTRVKHYALFPHKAIAYCLSHAGIQPQDVNAVAIAHHPYNQLGKKLKVLWQNPGLLGRKAARKSEPVPTLKDCLKEAGITNAKICNFEHHLAHLMSARVLSPKDDISLLSFDGLGDFVSAAIGRPTLDGIEIVDRVTFPHSLGYFFTAMTQYLGFPYFGDEFKVMGLSSLGKPKYVEALRQLIREDSSRFGFKLNLEVFPVSHLSTGHYLENGQPYLRPHFTPNLLRQIVGVTARKPKDPLTQEHADLAKSVQARFEEVANHLLKQLHDRVPSSTLAVAGGCAHNSVWVGKIPENSPFKNVLVFPAAHDSGIAVGAAALAARTTITVEGDHWGLLGPSHEGNDAQPGGKQFSSEAKLIDWIVAQLCEKKIVGLCHGRMEFGPRALGSRSIIADPRAKEMKEILNARVKHREKFRPFAASVLWEHQEKWFKNAFFAPYMEAVFEVKQPAKIPAVTHEDGSCRIQSVTKETQPFYWKLIDAFREKTGVPMLLNTSFNDSEPIVCTQEEAIRCFNTTDMDCLVVGNTVWEKTASIQKKVA